MASLQLLGLEAILSDTLRKDDQGVTRRGEGSSSPLNRVGSFHKELRGDEYKCLPFCSFYFQSCSTAVFSVILSGGSLFSKHPPCPS
jgi:hypothetical protein